MEGALFVPDNFLKTVSCMEKILGKSLKPHIGFIENLWVTSFENNKRIIENFELLKIKVASEREENYGFKIKAYNNVIKIITNFQYPIVDAKQVSNIKGIGAKSIAKIKEILQEIDSSNNSSNSNASLEKHGVIPKKSTVFLKTLEKDANMSIEKLQVLSLFEKILGVGPAKAEELYSLGYRKLEDIDISNLTKNQQIGLAFYDELNTKIPRDEMTRLDSIFEKLAENVYEKLPNPVEHNYKMVGSFRRGSESSSDIDILMYFKYRGKTSLGICELFVQELAKTNMLTHKINQGTNRFTGIIVDSQGIHRQLDVWIVFPNSWGTALLALTGPDSFNRHIRQIAKEQGYKLSEYNITRLSDDRKFYPTSEHEVFDFFKLPYLHPEDRELHVSNNQILKKSTGKPSKS